HDRRQRPVQTLAASGRRIASRQKSSTRRSARPVKPIASAEPTSVPARSKSSCSSTRQARSASDTKRHSPRRRRNGPASRFSSMRSCGNSWFRVVNAVVSAPSRRRNSASMLASDSARTADASHQLKRSGYDRTSLTSSYTKLAERRTIACRWIWVTALPGCGELASPNGIGDNRQLQGNRNDGQERQEGQG